MPLEFLLLMDGHQIKTTERWKMELKKWNHNNRATNLSVVIMHLKDHSVINVFSSSLRLFDPKRNVSTTVASFWFNKEHYMLLIFSKRVFF